MVGDTRPTLTLFQPALSLTRPTHPWERFRFFNRLPRTVTLRKRKYRACSFLRRGKNACFSRGRFNYTEKGLVFGRRVFRRFREGTIRV